VDTSVEVVAEAELVRNSASVGATFNNTQINQLPINGRNWGGLMTLTPGAIDTGAGNARALDLCTGRRRQQFPHRRFGCDFRAQSGGKQEPADDFRRCHCRVSSELATLHGRNRRRDGEDRSRSFRRAARINSMAACSNICGTARSIRAVRSTRPRRRRSG